MVGFYLITIKVLSCISKMHVELLLHVAAPFILFFHITCVPHSHLAAINKINDYFIYSFVLYIVICIQYY